MAELLSRYQNGNYIVKIYSDGTKIRIGGNVLEPEFPESIDLKITNRCPYNCPFCYANSTPNGRHGDILNLTFLDTIQAGTELAIGGGSVMCHPNIVQFLEKCKRLGIIANITVNQPEYMQNKYRIDEWQKTGLVKSIGVSLKDPKDYEFLDCIKNNPNIVLHIIAGVHSYEDLKILAEYAPGKFKLLVLGFKSCGRGETFNKDSEKVSGIMELLKAEYRKMWKQIESTSGYRFKIIKVSDMQNLAINPKNKFEAEPWFNVISFDNLALEQLDVKNQVPEEVWEHYYMGND